MKVHTYSRVSTKEQELAMQQSAMLKECVYKGWAITGEHADHGVSGGKGRDKRRGFNELCQAIEAGEVNIVMAWSVDRISRSLHDFLDFLMLCQKNNVSLHFIQNANLNTDDPIGMAMMQMMGVFAQLERQMISARVKESYDYRRAQGETNFGRKITYKSNDRAAVRAMHKEGKSLRQISEALNMSHMTVKRIIAG